MSLKSLSSEIKCLTGAGYKVKLLRTMVRYLITTKESKQDLSYHRTFRQMRFHDRFNM